MACRGDEQIHNGRYKEAVAAYTQALDETENRTRSKMSSQLRQARLYLHRSVAFRQLRRWKEAEEDAAKVVQLQPDNLNGCCNWAVCLKLLGRRSEAARACDIGLNKFPHNSALQRLRSEVLLHQNTVTFECDEPQNQVSSSPAPTQLDADTAQGESPSKIGSSCVAAGDTRKNEPPLLLRRRVLSDCAAIHEQKGQTMQLEGRQSDAHDSWAKRSRHLKRSKFARKMSLWWRLCRSDLPSKVMQSGVASHCQASEKQFTPSVLRMDCCKARTWAGSHGGQCTKKCGGSDFCRSHERDGKWKRHGRVDGPIPAAKLQEFLRMSKKISTAMPELAREQSKKRKSPHVGNHVWVHRNHEQGEAGIGSCVGLVVSEDSAKESVQVLVPPSQESWHRVCVQRHLCGVLREESDLDTSKRSPKRLRSTNKELVGLVEDHSVGI